MRFRLSFVLLFFVTTFSAAHGATGYLEGTGSNRPGEPVEDVEVLFYKLDKLLDKRITISGEIIRILDGRAIIIESGGVFNNEIPVVFTRNVQLRDLKSLACGQRQKIIGTVRRASLADIQKEAAWEPDPSQVKDLQKGAVWIVADMMVPLRR